jgi:hypothetical protein
LARRTRGSTGYPWAIALTGTRPPCATPPPVDASWRSISDWHGLGGSGPGRSMDGRAIGAWGAGRASSQRIVLETRSAGEVTFRLARRQGVAPWCWEIPGYI